MIDFYKVLGCTPETVTDHDIETLKMYEKQKSYPQRFKLKFSPAGTQIRNAEVNLILHGLQPTCINGPQVKYTVTLGNKETGE